MKRPRAKTAALALAAVALAGAAAVGWKWAGKAAAPASAPVAVTAPAAPAPPPSHVINMKPATAPFEEIEWFALVPADWEPAKTFNEDIARLQDNDPRAMEALAKLREAWATAPVEPSMDGARVRIGGYVIPLDGEGRAFREFLLVPYFGACIHAPPPPANQVIHVLSATPIAGVRMMDAVFVSGTLRAARNRTPDSAAGLLDAVGYDMQAQAVMPYDVK